MGKYLLHIVPWLLAAVLCAVPVSVVRRATTTPLPPMRATLLFTGDVMQHMPQVEAARTATGFNYGPVFDDVHPRFEESDLVVVNLETTLSTSGHYTGYPCFSSPAALADGLHDAGVDVALMANNHCCDAGAHGVRTTVAELSRWGIRHTGVFADSLDRVANNPLRTTLGGLRFALLNYTYGTNGIYVPHGITVNEIDTVCIAADLAALRPEEVDCTVVCIHWGEEYQRHENTEQRRLAAFLRRHGVNVVIGSHPHVIQPFEADESFVLFYSLGNFVSNQRQRFCDGGLMARVEVTMTPYGELSYAAQAIPVWVSLPDYRILPPEAVDTLSLSPARSRFYSDAAQILSTYESDL